MKILLCLATLVLSGCSSFTLPQVQGDNVIYHRTDPFGGTTITAKGVKVTEEWVVAEHADWVTTYPQFSVHLSVDGYRRKRAPDEKVP